MAPKSKSKFVHFLQRNQFLIWTYVVFFLVPILLMLTNQYAGLFDVVIFDHWVGNARVCVALLLAVVMIVWALRSLRSLGTSPKE